MIVPSASGVGASRLFFLFASDFRLVSCPRLIPAILHV